MTKELPKLGQDFVDSVREMMTSFGQTETEDVAKVDIRKSVIRQLRLKLLQEEYNEYRNAEYEDDKVEIADALGDMMVIIAGTAIAYGIDLPSVLAEIQRSNMSKVDPETGKVIRREDGKVLKPESYFAPNIESVM